MSAYYGDNQAVGDVSIGFTRKAVTALIGPSGCGKTTLLRCLNRIHEVGFDARVQGRVLLDGQDIYAAGIDPMSIRRRIGMVFQRPNPFPTLSILDNTLACAPKGLDRRQRLECAEKALRSAALWDEVKDKLRTSPLRLSGVSSSGSASRERLPRSRKCCSWTSRPHRSIQLRLPSSKS